MNQVLVDRIDVYVDITNAKSEEATILVPLLTESA
jgi:hypothetical protein